MTKLQNSGFPSSDLTEFFPGDGDTAIRMRAYDWTATSLGPPHTWPQSLKTVVRIMLASRYAMWMCWGPDRIFFYNDAYSPTLGVKRDTAVGRPADKVWAEIWPAIGPLISEVMQTGVANWNEDLLLFLERSGAPEETYHTFSYSPLAGDDGKTIGMFCVVNEDTMRVVGERRMATLRDLSAALNAITKEEDLLRASVKCLAAIPTDLPFTLTYLFDEAGDARLAGATGIAQDHAAAPALIAAGQEEAWPMAAIGDGESHITISGLDARFGALPTGPWDKPPRDAIVVPIKTQGQQRPLGAFIAGLNPYRPFDRDYEAFIELVANQIASAISNVRAFEQARQRAEALAQLDQAKTTFFSNVSHELRTPLTLMLGPLEETLANPGLQADDVERLRMAHRSGTRLLKLVNSLLDFSRIEAGRIQASYFPTDLAAVTADLASNFRSATEKAGLSLLLDCAPLPQPVYVDLDMWEKVVLNLMSNAFKFTFDGEIRVAVRERDGAAQLTVSDTGTGISAAELPRMFERFHRIEGARGRSFEGSGIGLALVQELVHLHGGSITVESEEGRGTAFTVTLPFGSAHLPQDHIREFTSEISGNLLRSASYVEEALSWLPNAEALAPPPVESGYAEPDTEAGRVMSKGERPYILLADDNADMRAYVGKLLGARYECEAVADGVEALEAVRRRRPDLLLTDVMMPRLDGFGLIREIRQQAGLHDLSIIALSARAGEEARIEGLSQGADDYLVKPFSAKELLARIDAVLAIARLRAQAHQALRESEVRFRNMADNAPVMIWTTDTTGHCTYLSRSWYEFTGQTPETGLGFGWLDATHPDDKAESERIFVASNASRAAFSLEYRVRRQDGVYRWAIDAAVPWYGTNGDFLGYIGSVIDITERKEIEEAQKQLNVVLEQKVADAIVSREKTEAQLRHAQKMEAVGKLTGGVAHDFNNLLQVIAGNLELLSRDVMGNEKAEQRLRNAVGGVTRGAKLASQLLAFGRRQPLAPKTVNLGRLVRNMDDMLRRALGEGVEVETVIAGGLWNTYIDASQVENALLNLAINARDAMRGHGKLTIEAGNAWLDDSYAQRHMEVSAGQYVMLAVSDTGCGIPQELLERVFEPFFTTKPEGEGTGLGLSMVYGFVKQSGGHLKVYSEEGHGTTVRMYLPRTREQEDIVAHVDGGTIVHGSETVLVVEDDEDVRSTVVETLTDLGYRVLKAKDADSALIIIESGVPIDVLFTDVVMPGKLRSPELARKARERMPNIAVLFTSGYTENSIVHGGKLDDGIDLLSKPYTREALARKIRHVLGNVPGNQQQKPQAAPREEQDRGTSTESAALRILIVEDDEMLRLTTMDLLEALGHAVHGAVNADEAIAFLDKESIDVMMTDLSLPGMSGDELARHVRAGMPDLAILFASGHDHPGVADMPLTAFVRKPYRIQELRQALESLTAPRR